MIQVAGTAVLLMLGLSTHSLPGFGFESGVLLLLGLLLAVSLIVLGIRPPAIRLQPQSIVVNRLGRSVAIDRDHFLDYSFRRAPRVVGGESTSSNRSLVISYRRDSGEVGVVPAFWSYRWLGLLSAHEQESAKKDLDHWWSEAFAAPIS